MKYIYSILLVIISSLTFGQWEIISPTIEEFDDNYQDIYFINKDTGFVIASIAEMSYERVLLRTTDGASTWDTIRKSDIGLSPYTNFLSIDFVNDSLGYISCNGDVLKTENAGETWYALDTADVLPSVTNWYNIIFVNADTGFIAYQDGGSQFLRTYDGGWTWEEDPVMSGIRNFNKHNGVVTGCWGGWAMLDLEVLEWTQGLGLLDHEDLTGLVFYNSTYHNGKLILTGYKSAHGAIYGVSEDDGETWVMYSFEGVVLEMFEIDFRNDLMGYAIGAFPGALKTWNGGASWHIMEVNNEDSEISKRFQDFIMIDDEMGYAISTNGIYKTTNGGGESTEELFMYEFTNIEELDATTFTIYPNPVDDYINLPELDIQIERIVICDGLGKVVLEAEKNEKKIDVSSLSTGQYIVIVSSTSGKYSARILKK